LRNGTEKTISGVHVSPGSAETLVRRGGIRHKHVIVYSLSNISAKNYQNRLMRVEVIKCDISVVFFETQCILTRNNTIDGTGYLKILAASANHARTLTALQSTLSYGILAECPLRGHSARSLARPQTC